MFKLMSVRTSKDDIGAYICMYQKSIKENNTIQYAEIKKYQAVDFKVLASREELEKEEFVLIWETKDLFKKDGQEKQEETNNEEDS